MKKYLYRIQRDCRYLLFFQLAMFAVGVLMVLIITRTLADVDRSYASVGALTSLSGLILVTIGSWYDMSLYVSMGVTRKSFLLWDLAEGLLLSVQGVVTVLLLGWAEEALYTAILPGWTNALPMMDYFSEYLGWGNVLLLLLAVLVSRFFNIAVFRKLGQQGGTFVFLGAILLFAFGPSAISSYRNGSTSILARIAGFFLENISAVGWDIIGAVAIAAMAVIAYLYLRRVEVRL